MLALLVLLSGCAPRGAIEYAQPLGEIVPPELEAVPGQARITRFDPPGAGERLELDLGLLARNPNDFGVRLERIEYRVILNGRNVGDASVEPDLYLEASGSAPLRFPVSLALPPQRNLLRAVARAFAGEPLPFRLEGRLRFASPGYGFESRDAVLVEGELRPRETVQAPTLRVDEGASRAYELRAGVPVVQVTLRADNPGEIGYFLRGKDLLLRLAGERIALEDLEPLPLPAGETRRVELLFYPDPAELGGVAQRALEAATAGISTTLDLRGELYMDVLGVDTFAVPGGLDVSAFLGARE